MRFSCLVFPGRETATLEGLPVRKISGNLLNPEIIDKTLVDCDAIIHAAASTAIWPGRNPKVVEVNREGTRMLRNAAKKRSD